MDKSVYKILFVDDEVLYHKIAQKYLQDWDVDYVFSGQDALEALKKENYAIVITDINMPGTDGISLLKKIKEQFSATQVIIITSSDDIGHLLETLQAGANDIILKPMDKEKLLETLNHSISKLQRWKKAFRELFNKKKKRR